MIYHQRHNKQLSILEIFLELPFVVILKLKYPIDSTLIIHYLSWKRLKGTNNI